MRSSLVISSLFLATFSYAQTPDPAPAPAAVSTETVSRIQERSMVDIGYLLPQGKLGLNLYANVYTEAYDIKQNSIPESKINVFGNRVGVEFSYGILDNLNIAAGINYVPGRRMSEELGNITTESRGWEEPTIGLQYRFLTQSESMPIDVVLDVSYSPKTDDSKWATPTSEGTVARGGDKTEIGFGFYRRASTGEFALVLNHAALGSTEGKSASGLTTITGKATGITSAMGIGQFPFNDNVFIRVGVGGTHYQETETTSAVFSKIEAYGTLDYLAGMRILIVPDRSMVDLAISAQSPVKSDIEVDDGGTKKQMTTAVHGSFFAGLKFLF